MELFCRNRGRCRWNHSWRTLLIIAWLGVWIQRASGQGSAADVITAKVGATAIIRTSVTGDIITYSWYRGTSAANGDQTILSYQGPGRPPLPGPQYTGRESALPDGSLQITDVQMNYTGNYTGFIQVAGVATPATFTRQLKVYELVPKPTVSINFSQPIENYPVALTCGNSNSATIILWFFNKSLLQPDSNRVTLSADNRTLTISRVSRSDDGSYKCEAQNPVSSSTSDPLTVTVSYGPEHPEIRPSQDVEVRLETEFRLTCTAVSVPEAQYQWLHNNTNISNPQSTYTKTSAAFADSGNYTCVASNRVTRLSAHVTAIVKISEVGPPVPPGPPGPPGPGVIVGIVIAVVVILIIVGFLIWYFCFKRPASGEPKEQTEMNGPAAASNPGAPATGKANGPAEDVQYTTVKFAPKSGKAAIPAVPEGTVYSEVRRK